MCSLLLFVVALGAVIKVIPVDMPRLGSRTFEANGLLIVAVPEYRAVAPRATGESAGCSRDTKCSLLSRDQRSRGTAGSRTRSPHYQVRRAKQLLTEMNAQHHLERTPRTSLAGHRRDDRDQPSKFVQRHYQLHLFLEVWPTTLV
jgi:hypothetical protein